MEEALANIDETEVLIRVRRMGFGVPEIRLMEIIEDPTIRSTLAERQKALMQRFSIEMSAYRIRQLLDDDAFQQALEMIFVHRESQRMRDVRNTLIDIATDREHPKAVQAGLGLLKLRRGPADPQGSSHGASGGSESYTDYVKRESGSGRRVVLSERQVIIEPGTAPKAAIVHEDRGVGADEPDTPELLDEEGEDLEETGSET